MANKAKKVQVIDLNKNTTEVYPSVAVADKHVDISISKLKNMVRKGVDGDEYNGYIVKYVSDDSVVTIQGEKINNDSLKDVGKVALQQQRMDEAITRTAKLKRRHMQYKNKIKPGEWVKVRPYGWRCVESVSNDFVVVKHKHYREAIRYGHVVGYKKDIGVE